MNEAQKEKRLRRFATLITNKQVLPKITLEEYGAASFFSVSPKEVRGLVLAYLRSHRPPYTADVKGGILFLNEENLGRIAALPPRIAVTETAAGFEEKILARQEYETF